MNSHQLVHPCHIQKKKYLGLLNQNPELMMRQQMMNQFLLLKKLQLAICSQAKLERLFEKISIFFRRNNLCLIYFSFKQYHFPKETVWLLTFR
jgi:hypothetical protein